MQGAGCRVQGAGCRVQGAGCRVQGEREGGERRACSVVKRGAIATPRTHAKRGALLERVIAVLWKLTHS